MPYAVLFGAAFGAVCASVVLGGFTGVDGWALNHLMPWLGSGKPSVTVASVLLPFHLGASPAQIASDLWVYPASFPVSALVIGLLSAFLWRSGRRRAAVTWSAAWLVANLAELLGKTFVSRPALHKLSNGPWQTFFAHSFPSGHALRGLLVAALVGLVWHRARVVAAAWAASTLVLLVPIGFHTPSDVLGGALLAGALICLALPSLEAEVARPALEH